MDTARASKPRHLHALAVMLDAAARGREPRELGLWSISRPGLFHMWFCEFFGLAERVRMDVRFRLLLQDASPAWAKFIPPGTRTSGTPVA